MRLFFLLVLIVLFFGNCQSIKKTTQANEVRDLVKLMSGTFNNTKQSRADTAFSDISLRMYPIWKERKGENWLYVEQAVRDVPKRPYRQRVYKVEQVSKDLYQSIVYTLPDAQRFIGKWNAPTAFDIIAPDSLIERRGCTVYLRKISEDYFRGGTKEGSCESSLRGASYTTSEVEMFADKIMSWDRGFDKKGKQVWGATKGGYVFDKKEGE